MTVCPARRRWWIASRRRLLVSEVGSGWALTQRTVEAVVSVRGILRWSPVSAGSATEFRRSAGVCVRRCGPQNISLCAQARALYDS